MSAGRHYVECTLGGYSAPYVHFGVVASDFAPDSPSKPCIAHNCPKILHCFSGAGTTVGFVVDLELGAAAYRRSGVWHSLGRIDAPAVRWVADLKKACNHSTSCSCYDAQPYNHTCISVEAKPVPHVPPHILQL